MGEVGNFYRGSLIVKAEMREIGELPAIHYGEIHTHYGVWANQTKSYISSRNLKAERMANPGDLVIATTSEDDEGAGKAVAWLGERPAAISTDAYIFRHDLEPRYLSYFFQTQAYKTQKSKFITGTKVRRVHSNSLSKISLFLPPIELQKEIANTLDKFDALVNDISIGLPAELAARRKQYEYYRDRLLSFEEVAA